jgi:Ca2+-binding RTX toxin-like protein
MLSAQRETEMLFGRALVTLAVAGLMFTGTVGGAVAAQPADKVTLCHATGSATNPYVEITVSENAAAAHQRHGDFVLPEGAECPGSTPPAPGPGDPGPFVACVVGPGVTQTATTVTGTSADDTIDCTNASPGKTITGGDGNDTITGTAFNDNIDGGNGNDTITGGPGDDTIEGGNGNDTLTGSGGDDNVTDEGDGNDTITT